MNINILLSNLGILCLLSWSCQKAPTSFDELLLKSLSGDSNATTSELASSSSSKVSAYHYWSQAQKLRNQDSSRRATELFEKAAQMYANEENAIGQFWSLSEMAFSYSSRKKDTAKLDSIINVMEPIIQRFNEDEVKFWAEQNLEFVRGLRWYGREPYDVEESVAHLKALILQIGKSPRLIDSTLVGRIYYSLGDINFGELGNYQVARKHLEKSLLFKMKEEISLDLSTCLLTYSWLKEEEGEYNYSSQLLYQALGIRQYLLSNKHAKVANTWHRLGTSYYERNLYNESRSAYSEAYNLMHQIDKYPVHEFYYLNNLSSCLEQLGEVAQAKQFYQKAVDFINQKRDNSAAFHQQEILNYLNRAALHINEKDYINASKFLNKSDALLEKYDSPAFLYPEMNQLLYAEYYLKTHQYAKAIHAMEQAKKLHGIEIQLGEISTSEDFEPYDIIQVLNLDVQIFEAAHSADIDMLKSTLAKYLSLINYANDERLFYNLQEDQIETGEIIHRSISKALDISHKILELAPRRNFEIEEQVFKLMELGKNQVLQQTLAKAAILQRASQTPAFKTSIKTHTPTSWKEKGIPSKSYLLETNKQLQSLIQGIHTDNEILEDAALTDSLLRRSTSLREVQQSSLQKGELLIEYTFTENTLWELSISQEKHQLRRLEINDDIPQKIEQFKRAVQDSDVPDRIRLIQEHGFQLFELFIQPILKYHFTDEERPSHLTFIPDGYFHHFPFEVLLTHRHTGTDFRKFPFLIDQYPVNYAFSQGSRNKKHAFTFPPKSASELLSISTFDKGILSKPIPIASGIQTLTLWGADATKSKWLAEAPNYNMLQIISHGFANEEMANPYLLLNAEGGEEGKLQMAEIAKAHLSANLVVLAACEGAVGEVVSGEGSLNILRALRMAGVKNMVGGIAKVNATTLPDILRRFYQELEQGAGIPKAMQQAKLNYWKNASKTNSDPAFWGALVSFSQ